ncbi:asparagine synthase (glutamine-hydrolysing) [Maribacter caenipelagi]|uniref:asparagine synthase (glutamine-hydrolyzing) n=1 Tax=Maribacter caenipelagi TaxID=1447781 RepID=A0A4R7D1M0_9FLAO|nr:asparagine synthase (glutamine-hydrolyzing) [Maribacter caenipelagi]TDS13435.1 asparagine synthase (glutamine-hydrolysing) [Maribacter caenipelagi]
MCGIYGSTIGYSKEEVKKKLERTNFRGPDQSGIQIYRNQYSNVILGHNRLSIIDLDQRSNQPFNYFDKISIVFNGEIYNYLDLKKELISKGYSFSTESDTEVICASYLEYGEECVKYFNGMFAFVIYDYNKNLLFGAKDRLGQKPFYYYLGPSGFEFASQISSIQLFNKDLTVSSQSIKNFFIWYNVSGEQSIFNEIKKLKDGYCFKFDLISKKYSDWQYWDIKYTSNINLNLSFNEAKLQLEDLLTDSIRLRMIADVPLGVFLSGGVDSSLIAALAAKSSSTKVKTFSVRFSEKDFDESIYAQKVAQHLNTDHHIIDCNYKEGLNLIQNFSEFYDEPFADASAIPSMLLAKYTKPHVTVALSGDGADEAFMGYRRYAKLDKIKRTLKIPYSARKLSSELISCTNNKRFNALKALISAKSSGDAYLDLISDVNSSWFLSNLNIHKIPELKYLNNPNKNFHEQVSDFDLKTYLSWDINTKVDRATMAYSLEARSPFLDYRVIEFARGLPLEYKFQKDNQKRILKSILYDHVPKELFNRTKSGFSMPFEKWFRNELKDYVLSELSHNNLKNIPGINVKEVCKMIDEHMLGKWNHYQMIWSLLVLKQWLDKNANGLRIV